MNRSAFYRVCLLSLAHGLNHAFLVFYTPLFTLILKELNVDYLAIGGLATFAYLTYGLGALPAGLLSDRFGQKLTVVTSILVAGLGALVGTLATGYWSLALAFALIGMAASLYHPSANALLSGLVDEDSLGKAMGLHGIGANLVLVLAPSSAGFLASLFSWRTAFLVWGLIGILVGWSLWRFLPPTTLSSSPSPKVKSSLKKLMTQAVLLILTITAVQGFSFSGIFSFLPTYLQKVRRMSIIVSGIVAGIQFGGGILGLLLGGYLSDKLNRKTPLLIGTIGGLMAFFFIPLVPTGWSLLLTIATMGSCLFMLQVAMTTSLADVTPPEIRGASFGLFFGITNSVGATSPLVAGLIARQYSFDHYFFLLVILYLFCLPLIALLRIRRTFR